MPILRKRYRMRSCDERGGATTTTTTTTGAIKSSSSTASSSSSVKMAEKTRRGSRRYLSNMLKSHYSRSNHFYNESCDFSDYTAPRSSDSSLVSTYRCRSSKHESEKTRNDAVTPPWNQRSSSPTPYKNSPWTKVSSMNESFRRNGLIGSILREEGHIYSLAVSRDLIYTGSDSKNIRVWKNLKDFSGFKSSSGLVKAIVLSGDKKIFTGHQDGKIRVWRATSKDLTDYKRVGSLPNFRDFVKKSFNPKNYVEVRRHRSVLRIKHYDAVSCLSLNEEKGLLYSGSWDRTLKVWRVSDSKCVDSVNAHDDAVNAVVTAFDTLVFTGSADGTVKVWRREFDSVNGKSTGAITHSLQQVLLKQENAVTALAANAAEGVLYCGASDGLLNYWECGKKLSHGGILKGHKLAVLCLEAAGRLVFSGGADKSICVWRRGDDGVHTCLSVLSGHTGPVKCLAVQAEDDHEESSKEDKTWVVYSGSLDKTVKVWRVSEQSPDFRKLNLI